MLAPVRAPAAATRAPSGDLGLLVALVLIGVALRPQLGAVGPLIPRIQHELGISHAVAGLLGTIPVLCMGLFAFFAAGIARRLGTARAVGLALLLTAVAGVLRVVVPDAWEVLLLTVPVGIGIAVGGTLMPVAVRELLPGRTGTGTGAYAGGMNVGSASAPALAVPLAVWLGGWRESLAALAVAGGVRTVGWFALTARAAAGARARGEAAPAATPRAPLPLRSPMAWVCCGVFGLMGVSFYGLAAWLPDSLQEHGWGEASSGYVLAVAMFASVPVTMSVPKLAERVGSRRSWLVAGVTLNIVAVALYIEAPDLGWVWAAPLGASLGIEFTTLMSLPLDLGRGAARVAAAAGLILGVGYVISAAGPFALGAARDATGSYSTSLWIVCGSLATVGLLSLPLTRERLQRAAEAEAAHD